MAATATWPCPDCGHLLPMEFELTSSGALVGDQGDITGRMKRHVMLNPDVHPTFVLAN